MASRSSTGIGVGITITLLGLACLALFITTVVFFSKFNGAQKNYVQLNERTADFVREGERETDQVRRLVEVSRQNQMSVVGFLNDSLRKTMSAVTGSANDSFEQFSGKVAAVEGASGNNLLGVVRSRDASITDLESKLAEAEKNRQTALADLANEATRTRALEESHRKTIETMNSDIDKYKAEIEVYRLSVGDAKQGMDERVERIINASAQTESALKERLSNLEGENLQLKDQISRLRGEKSADLLRPRPEESLVDGEVVAINQAANTVTINRGLRDKMILGMSFAVYADQTAIKPDAAGNYPRGKANIEVTNVGDTSSTARITQETRGNPVIRGDVIANAIYDTNKVYTFLVYGNFDANGDGFATAGEAEDIKAMIIGWNGKVTNELTGEVDFLVLGQRPQLPPRPGLDTPSFLVDEYMRLDRIAQTYDQFLRQAAATSVPVLNENRLYTLIGRRMSR